MRHSETLELLPDFVAGRIRPSERSQVEAHLTTCEECMGSVEMYRLFAESLNIDSEITASDHPTSAELARFVLDSEGQPDAIRDHLETCPSCDRELELCRRAIRGVRGRRSEALAAVAAYVSSPPARMVLAASLLLVALTSAVLLSPSRRTDGSTQEISGRKLAGQQVIAAQRVIRATEVEIESGSAISFRAGELVALGEGFVVDSDATFSVEISGSPRQRSSPSSGRTDVD